MTGPRRAGTRAVREPPAGAAGSAGPAAAQLRGRPVPPRMRAAFAEVMRAAWVVGPGVAFAEVARAAWAEGPDAAFAEVTHASWPEDPRVLPHRKIWCPLRRRRTASSASSDSMGAPASSSGSQAIRYGRSLP